jgi:glutaconyl-CoA/methylmalonyl-CoA decarboxylase subunit gamma
MYTITINGREFAVELLAIEGTTVRYKVDNNEYTVNVQSLESSIGEGKKRSVNNSQSKNLSSYQNSTNDNKPLNGSYRLISPISGIVSSLLKKTGERVASGEKVAIIEAMKMENPIFSEKSGVIKEIFTTVGSEVKAGDTLSVIENEIS